ncbi:IPExxxVDY family protein [Bacteroidota bacterium]
MAPKKHKLSVSIEEDYCLLGISSDEPDYKVCWLINENARFSLTREDDLVLYNRKNVQEQVFSYFIYEDENTRIIYRLISNRTDTGFFLPELSNIDYVLHIQGDIHPEGISSLLSVISSIPAVRLCVPINLKKLKSQDRLQLW